MDNSKKIIELLEEIRDLLRPPAEAVSTRELNTIVEVINNERDNPNCVIIDSPPVDVSKYPHILETKYE